MLDRSANSNDALLSRARLLVKLTSTSEELWFPNAADPGTGYTDWLSTIWHADSTMGRLTPDTVSSVADGLVVVALSSLSAFQAGRSLSWRRDQFWFDKNGEVIVWLSTLPQDIPIPRRTAGTPPP